MKKNKGAIPLIERWANDPNPVGFTGKTVLPDGRQVDDDSPEAIAHRASIPEDKYKFQDSDGNPLTKEEFFAHIRRIYGEDGR